MSNDNVDYYSKYLKYKKKYLDLQLEIEGGKKKKSNKIAAGKDLYTAGYKAYAGTIKGAAGVCLASADTMNKFHATEISKTTAKKQLQAYQNAKGTAKTFGDLRKETGYSCAMTNKAKSAASSAGKAAGKAGLKVLNVLSGAPSR